MLFREILAPYEQPRPHLGVVNGGLRKRSLDCDVFLKPELCLVKTILQGPNDNLRDLVIIELRVPERPQARHELCAMFDLDITAKI